MWLKVGVLTSASSLLKCTRCKGLSQLYTPDREFARTYVCRDCEVKQLTQLMLNHRDDFEDDFQED